MAAITATGEGHDHAEHDPLRPVVDRRKRDDAKGDADDQRQHGVDRGAPLGAPANPLAASEQVAALVLRSLGDVGVGHFSSSMTSVEPYASRPS
jgi:hypothetical protein